MGDKLRFPLDPTTRELCDYLRTLGAEMDANAIQKLYEQREELKQERDSLQSQLSKAHSDIQLMVEKAAMNHRPAYDEQQKRIMDMESQLSEARAYCELQAAHLRILISAIGSLNRGKAHEVFVHGYGETRYAQRKEWVEWILEEADKANSAIKETPAQSLDEIISKAFMAGQADCGIDPSYSSAMEYASRLRQQGKGKPDERSCMYDEYDEVE